MTLPIVLLLLLCLLLIDLGLGSPVLNRLARLYVATSSRRSRAGEPTETSGPTSPDALVPTPLEETP